MKIEDIVGHLTMPLNNEEVIVMEKIGDKYSAEELSPREQMVAQNLVRRGALNKDIKDDSMYYYK